MEKYLNAAAVSISNSVKLSDILQTSETYFAKSSFEISLLFILIRSVYSTKWGLVYSPTLKPEHFNIFVQTKRGEYEYVGLDYEGDSISGKTTDIGYINKNNQRNNGRKCKSDNHYNQWFYELECLDCGYKYNANGSDIWLRKCPSCQDSIKCKETTEKAHRTTRRKL